MKKERWQKWASVLICAVISLFFLRWLVTYAAGPLLVCGISLMAASAVQPMAKRISGKIGIPKGICAMGCMILLFLVLGGLLTWGAIRLWREVSGAFSWLSSHWDEFLGELDRSVGVLLAGMPEEGAVSVAGTVAGWLRNILQSLGGVLTACLGGMLRATPRALMTVGVLIVACLYLSADYDQVMKGLARLLSPSWRKRASALQTKLFEIVLGYTRAYGILLALTFLEVLTGMVILRQPYGFLIAVCVALIDILPVLGAGIVLIPWGLISLAGGRIGFGVGLLILYGVMTVIRQLVEPRLVGGSIGLHPLCSLLAMFAGFWCFGALGMLAAPVLAKLIWEGKSLFEGNEKNL